MSRADARPRDKSADTVLTQAVRYVVVGIVANLAGYLSYILFTELGMTPRSSMTLVYVAVATLGYLGNRSFTFRERGTFTRSSRRYVLAHLLGYSLNWTLLTVFVTRLGYAHQLVQAVAIVLVASLLFVVLRHFVFAGETAARNSEGRG